MSAQQARERKKSYVSNLEQAAKGNEQQVMLTGTCSELDRLGPAVCCKHLLMS